MRRLLPAVVLLLLAASCGSSVPLTEAISLEDVVTGWYDAGVTDDGKTKIVPSISMRLRNKSNVHLGTIQLNCIFKRVGDPEEWSTALVRAASELPPGAVTPAIVVRAPQGYTGTQPRTQLLENKLFVDAKVEVFGKHGSSTWVKLGDFKIARQLLTH